MIDMRKVFEKYDITEDGVVSNKVNGHRVPYQVNKNGYYKVSLWIGKVVNVRVSRMVALKYLPNPMGYEEVNHKDGDKGNNHVLNLEWCSGEMNKDHSVRTGLSRVGERHERAKLKDSDVVEIRRRIGAGDSFRKVYGDYEGVIGWWSFREICRGRTWRHLL